MYFTYGCFLIEYKILFDMGINFEQANHLACIFSRCRNYRMNHHTTLRALIVKNLSANCSQNNETQQVYCRFRGDREVNQ